MQVNVHTAKTTLSHLILRAEASEEVVIARRGKPAVRLVPVREGRVRTFGLLARLAIEGDVTGMLGEDEQVLWDGA